MIKEIPFYKLELENKDLDSFFELNCCNVKKLEDEIKDFIGAKHVISTINATLSIHLALSAIDIKRADKVAVSINNHVSVAESVRVFDAEPIFIDTDKDGFNIDLDKLENFLKNNTNKKLRAVVVNFLSGKLLDLDRLYDIKKRYNIILIEDGVGAFGAMKDGKMVGNLEADITIFSLNSDYEQNTINSGFIVTNNDEFASRARLLSEHAILRYRKNENDIRYIYDVVDIGYGYKMSELEAYFNSFLFYKTNNFIESRQEIAKYYIDSLSGLKHIKVPIYDDEQLYSQFIIKVIKNRDSFARELKKRGIETKIHYIPLHTLSYYKEKYNLKITSFPNVLNSYSQVLSIPIYPSITKEEMEHVVKSIKEIDKNWV